MENPVSDSAIIPTEIKKDKLSETMESPTVSANIENVPVLQEEANTTVSHRPDSTILNQETEKNVVENIEQNNNESTQLPSSQTPIINIEMVNNEENTPINENNNSKNNNLTEIPDIDTTPLPPINTNIESEKNNNPNLNSASSTSEVLTSAWSSVSNYLWSWFETPPEATQGENEQAKNVNNNNNTQNESDESQSGGGYYANLLSSFFRPSTDNLDTQTMKKSSSLSSSRLNLLSQQAVMPQIKFVGLDDEEEDSVKPIVNHELSDYIRPHLPLYQRESVKWVLRYSTARHGISLNTLYQKVEKAGPLLVAIRDTDNNVFGAYVSEPFHVEKGFYGTRECFLWKYLKGSLKMYPTSGNNEYFIHSEPDFIAIGGGNGNYGLYIDEDIQNGQSDECTAFFNEPLSSSIHFQILTLEVWSFEM